jgi:Leucine-rich repeat (LRR) protein
VRKNIAEWLAESQANRLITSLQQLCLAHNNLSGQIPGLLGNQTSLLRLDLSFNNLQDEVP